MREGYIRDVYHEGFHSRPTPLLRERYFNFTLFLGHLFLSYIVPCVASCRVLFPAGFFWPPSDSAIFVSCRSALFHAMYCMYLDVIRGCSVTFCYSSRCSEETTKINLMVLLTLFTV